MNRGKIKEAVMETLVKYPKARANDNELIYLVLQQLNMPTDYSELRKDPTNVVETIRRVRCKIQVTNPLLRPEKQVSRRRQILEEKYRKEMTNV